MIQKWRNPENAKWKTHFFVDPNDSVPPQNEDTKKRSHALKFVPNINDYKWKSAEIDNLLDAIKSCSDSSSASSLLPNEIDWKKVQSAVPTKSIDQLRLKYFCQVCPKINFKEFSREESLKIIELVHVKGGQPKWEEVCFFSLPSNLSNFYLLSRLHFSWEQIELHGSVFTIIKNF